MMTNRLRMGLAAAAVAVLALAGCGDDDQEAGSGTTTEEANAETATAGEADLGAYCDATLRLETAPEPDLDFESASPEDIGKAMADYYETLRPLADEILETAPGEVADDVQVLSGALDELPTAEDDPFDQPEAAAAERRVHEFSVATCDWNVVDVNASEYAFDGVPAESAAGPTSFELTNDGAEVHQLLLARINDGVTQSAAEIVQLPEEEAMALVTVIPGDAFVAPGEHDYLVADLEPGRYVVACFVPVGTMPDGPPPDGPPHAVHGMVTELTVS